MAAIVAMASGGGGRVSSSVMPGLSFLGLLFDRLRADVTDWVRSARFLSWFVRL
jgi:hypothetical protein